MAAHIPKQARVKNDLHALEQQAIADDEGASLLANQQAQVSLIYSTFDSFNMSLPTELL